MLNVPNIVIIDDSPRNYVTLPNGDTISYSLFVARCMKEMGSFTLNALHAAVGISGEAGELLDAVKKHWAYEKPLDMDNVVEELGDLEVYMTAMRLLIGVTRDEVLQRNASKLSKRYSTGSYSNEQAQARADKAETPDEALTLFRQDHGKALDLTVFRSEPLTPMELKMQAPAEPLGLPELDFGNLPEAPRP